MQLKVISEGEMARQPPSDGAEGPGLPPRQCALRQSETCLRIIFVRDK